MQIYVDPSKQTKTLGNLFGIFLEDLNHALDGGLYGELVQNRDFEFDPVDHPEYHALTAWSALGDAEVSVHTEEPAFPENPHIARIVCSAGSGIANEGYWGIPTKAGVPIHLRMWARSRCGMVVRVILGQAERTFALAKDWSCFEGDLIPAEDSGTEQLKLLACCAGSFELAYVSLIPSDCVMGCFRPDIYQAFADMKPKFIRFPGGCLIHAGQLDPAARDGMYNWKNTVGQAERRPGRRNNWHYHQTFGIGFYEFFCLCEMVGAEPLPVVSGGCNPHGRLFAEGEMLERYIQDALDLIDFAKGGEDTVWGAVRSRMGHPAPFSMKYLGVGNEEVHQAFFDRYPRFVEAIRQKDPSIRIVGTSGPFAAGGEYERGWRCAEETRTDIVDEHYYQGPDWFYANIHRYDAFDPKGPKVFLGEYASWSNRMESALAEAAYMTHLQSAPAVELACYAPLLLHVRYANWRPDMLWYDNRRLCRTVNYHVQKLFASHQGDTAIGLAITDNDAGQPLDRPVSGLLRLEADRAALEIREQRIRTPDGEKAYPDVTLSGRSTAAVDETGDHFTYTCRVRRTEGKTGLHIQFGYQSDSDRWQWCFGGWENQDTLLERKDRGLNTCITQTEFSIETGLWYDLKLEVQGHHLRTYINGELMNDAEELPVKMQPLYAAASMETDTGALILKVVNPHAEARSASVRWGCPGILTAYVLQGQPEEANTLEEPDRLVPAETTQQVNSEHSWTFAPYSVTVMVLQRISHRTH